MAGVSSAVVVDAGATSKQKGSHKIYAGDGVTQSRLFSQSVWVSLCSNSDG